MAQYPLDMGRPDKARGGGGKGDQTLALTVNAEGDINYDAVLSGAKNAQKWMDTHLGHKALVPKIDQLAEAVSTGCAAARLRLAETPAAAHGQRLAATQAALRRRSANPPSRAAPHSLGPQDLSKPDEEEVAAAAQETAAALARQVERKGAALNPKTLPSQPGGAQFIKYTPSNTGACVGGRRLRAGQGPPRAAAQPRGLAAGPPAAARRRG